MYHIFIVRIIAVFCENLLLFLRLCGLTTILILQSLLSVPSDIAQPGKEIQVCSLVSTGLTHLPYQSFIVRSIAGGCQNTFDVFVA